MSAPNAEDLWPSLDESIGRQPCFPSGPAWAVLPTLKGQIEDMLGEIGPNHREGVSIDSSKGIVHIDGSAIIEPGIHIIGPAYIGPNATIRHGAYIREYSWICFCNIHLYCCKSFNGFRFITNCWFAITNNVLWRFLYVSDYDRVWYSSQCKNKS